MSHITEKRIPVHGRAGLKNIIDFACQEQKTGTCDGTRPPQGSASFVFGRLANMLELRKQPSIKKIGVLANLMIEDDENSTDGPADAGLTFFGQFIDHDITLDATTKLGQVAGAVNQIRNFRTPSLDLDCVYGDGPEVDPWLYEQDRRLIFGRGKIGKHPSNDFDLQRNVRGRALIGDPRNDENLFVSQIHGRQFVARHNELMAQLEQNGLEDVEQRFDQARADLTLEYHHRIIDEFLPAIIHDSVYQPMLAQAKQGRLDDIGRIEWSHAPIMPVEFSAAAYRFGHSMVREFYTLNDIKGRENVRIFAQGNDDIKLHGFSPVSTANNLEFAHYFGENAQKARPIDTLLPAALHTLPDEVAEHDKNLAARNMVRGQHTFKLPTGEKMAKLMDLPQIDTHEKVKEAKLEGKTPLWFYILAEAEQHQGKLGPVGGGLVAGVLLNLLIRSNSLVLRCYRGHC